MSSVGEYKTVGDVISDLNVMIVEAPVPNNIRMKLAEIVSDLGYGVREGLDDACRGAFSDSPPDVEADVEWLDDVEDE